MHGSKLVLFILVSVSLCEDITLYEIPEITLLDDGDDIEIPLLGNIAQPTRIDNNEGEISFYTMNYQETTYLLTNEYPIDLERDYSVNGEFLQSNLSFLN